MTKFVLYAEDERFSPNALSRLSAALSDAAESEVPLAVEFVLVDETEIRRLNRELRDTDKVTDVLSFPAFDGISDKPFTLKAYQNDLDENGNLLIGSVAVCVQRAKEQAEEYGHSYERELFYLFVHGILHCLGYDHETEEDKREMRSAEEKILAKVGLQV